MKRAILCMLAVFTCAIAQAQSKKLVVLYWAGAESSQNKTVSVELSRNLAFDIPSLRFGTAKVVLEGQPPGRKPAKSWLKIKSYSKGVVIFSVSGLYDPSLVYQAQDLLVARLGPIFPEVDFQAARVPGT